jgi:hypothetical protein
LCWINLGWEAGLEADKLHMGVKVLAFEILVLATTFTLEKCLPCKSDPPKPSPLGVMPLIRVRFSAPLSIEEAMTGPNKENPQRKEVRFGGYRENPLAEVLIGGGLLLFRA